MNDDFNFSLTQYDPVRHTYDQTLMTGTDSTSTNLRVVFDASAKTSNNISLNDKLMVGPTIQKSLFSIILRFRKHSVAISADTYKSDDRY
jgi:hypothetical protein